VQERSPPRRGGDCPLPTQSRRWAGCQPCHLPWPSTAGQRARTDTHTRLGLYLHRSVHTHLHLTCTLSMHIFVLHVCMCAVCIYTHTHTEFSSFIFTLPWAFPHKVSYKADCQVKLQLQGSHSKATANAVESIPDSHLGISITRGERGAMDTTCKKVNPGQIFGNVFFHWVCSNPAQAAHGGCPVFIFGDFGRTDWLSLGPLCQG